MSGDEGRAGQLNRTIALVSQRQLETCIKFRNFAARNMFVRGRFLRSAHMRLDLWRAVGDFYERRLCGGRPEAEAKASKSMDFLSCSF